MYQMEALEDTPRKQSRRREQPLIRSATDKSGCMSTHGEIHGRGQWRRYRELSPCSW